MVLFKQLHFFCLFYSLLLLSSTGATVAQEKPDFKVQTLKGEQIQLKELYAKGPTLIAFWALWCEPCKIELKALKSLYRKYQGKGFSLLTINQDSPKSVAKVRAFVASQEIPFDVVLDPNGELLQSFNGQSVPYSLLYDTTGHVAAKHIGYKQGDEKQIENELQKLLSKKE